MSNFWKIFISVVTTIVVGVYYVMERKINSEKSDGCTEALNNLPKPPWNVENFDTADTSSWKTYNDKKAAYSFKYPADWTLSDNSNNSVTLETPAEKKAGDQCVSDAIKNGGGDCSTLGSELFAVYSFPNGSRIESSTESYAIQGTTLNNISAKFFIDPTIVEHFVWEIQKGGNSYEVMVRTPSNLFVESKLIIADDYYKALASAQSFKLN